MTVQTRAPFIRRSISHTVRVILGFCVLATVMASVARIAKAEDALDRPISFNIPENTNLEDALIEWGIDVGMTVMVNTETVHNLVVRKVVGTLTARKALELLLWDSGQSYIQEGARICVVPNASLRPSA